MTDKELIIDLKLSGLNSYVVCYKMECTYLEVEKVWKEEKKRRALLIDNVISASDVAVHRKTKDISIPTGITRGGLVTHVIMDLDHYLGLTNAEAKPE